MKVLISGAAGFICGYLLQELLEQGYEVVGLDNFSKYGRSEKSYDRHPCYRFVEGDAKDAGLLRELLADCDHFVAAAAMIGGISYFHEFAYDLLAENERITAASFDAAIGPIAPEVCEDYGAFFQHGVREHRRISHSRRSGAALSSPTFHLRLSETGY